MGVSWENISSVLLKLLRAPGNVISLSLSNALEATKKIDLTYIKRNVENNRHIESQSSVAEVMQSLL